MYRNEVDTNAEYLTTHEAQTYQEKIRPWLAIISAKLVFSVNIRAGKVNRLGTNHDINPP